MKIILFLIVYSFLGTSSHAQDLDYNPFKPYTIKKPSPSNPPVTSTNSRPKVIPEVTEIHEKHVRKYVPVPQETHEQNIRVLGKILIDGKNLVLFKDKGTYYVLEDGKFHKNCKVTAFPIPHVDCYRIEQVKEHKVVGDQKRTTIEEVKWKVQNE